MRTARITLTTLLGASMIFLAAACGGSSSNTQTTSPEAAAKAWAGGVCLAFTTWQNDLKTAGQALAKSPSQNQLFESVADAKTATNKLRDTLKGIGPAPEGTTAAQNALDTLRSELKSEADTIQSLVDGVSNLGEAATAAPKVQAEVQKMQASLKTAGTTLKGLPENSPLAQGFKDAPNCQSLGS